MNLQQLKAKYGQTSESKSVSLPGLFGKSKPAETKTVSQSNAVVLPGLWGKTKSTTKTVATAVIKTAPVTTRRFDNMVAEMNAKHNDHEREIFKNKLMVHMVAQATGVNLPSDEEMDELYEEYLKDQQEQIEELNETEALAEVESTISTIISSVTDSVLSALNDKLNITSDVEDEIVEVTDEVEEEVEETPAPKKEVKGGRRKLGRQAPLAE